MTAVVSSVLFWSCVVALGAWLVVEWLDAVGSFREQDRRISEEFREEEQPAASELDSGPAHG